MLDPRAITLADVDGMPRLGGITTEEDRLIGELMEDAPDTAQNAAELADLISQAEGITRVEAKAVVDGYGQPDQDERAVEIAEKHRDAIRAHHAVARTYGYCLMDATITAFLQSRGGSDGMGLPEWGLKSTKRLMRAVYLAIWELAQQEIQAEKQPKAEDTEESLGKRSTAPSTSGRTGRKRTGA